MSSLQVGLKNFKFVLDIGDDRREEFRDVTQYVSAIEWLEQLKPRVVTTFKCFFDLHVSSIGLSPNVSNIEQLVVNWHLNVFYKSMLIGRFNVVSGALSGKILSLSVGTVPVRSSGIVPELGNDGSTTPLQFDGLASRARVMQPNIVYNLNVQSDKVGKILPYIFGDPGHLPGASGYTSYPTRDVIGSTDFETYESYGSQTPEIEALPISTDYPASHPTVYPDVNDGWIYILASGHARSPHPDWVKQRVTVSSTSVTRSNLWVTVYNDDTDTNDGLRAMRRQVYHGKGNDGILHSFIFFRDDSSLSPWTGAAGSASTIKWSVSEDQTRPRGRSDFAIPTTSDLGTASNAYDTVAGFSAHWDPGNIDHVVRSVMDAGQVPYDQHSMAQFHHRVNGVWLDTYITELEDSMSWISSNVLPLLGDSIGIDTSQSTVKFHVCPLPPRGAQDVHADFIEGKDISYLDTTPANVNDAFGVVKVKYGGSALTGYKQFNVSETNLSVTNSSLYGNTWQQIDSPHIVRPDAASWAAMQVAAAGSPRNIYRYELKHRDDIQRISLGSWIYVTDQKNKLLRSLGRVVARRFAGTTFTFDFQVRNA